MAKEIASNVLSGIIGGFIALVSNKLLSRPFLEISKISEPIIILAVHTDEFGEDTEYISNAYRLEIINKRKFLFGESAQNCRCEMSIDYLTPDTFRLPWLYFEKEAQINCESIGEIQFCARCTDNAVWSKGSIIAPLDNNYENVRKIGDGDVSVTGKIRVTSENGGHTSKKFIITPIVDDKLQISFS